MNNNPTTRIQAGRVTSRVLRLCCIVSLLLPFVSCSYNNSSNAGSNSTGGTPVSTRPVTWSDEFNQADGSPPDPTKWSFDTGGDGWGNEELQTYTSRPQNVQVVGGNLAITAIQEDYVGTDGILRNYTSARIKTHHKFSQKYGRFEARIKLPTGVGVWPAFWIMGENVDTVPWPDCGEIDIMENIGNLPATVYSTVHGPNAGGGAYRIGATYNLPSGQFSDDFHVFAMEWSPNVLEFYVDGTLYSVVTPGTIPVDDTWVFDHPFFIVLNVAVGGVWSGPPNSSTVFPQTMLVDYVRVYAPQ